MDCDKHIKLRKIAVYCGSSSGKKDEYLEAAINLGKELVSRKLQLVYGGGNVGLMGAIARTVSEGLGEHSVLGVIPEALQPKEVSGEPIGKVVVVSDIHVRKALMSAEADAFIAIPGGFGTLEELLEMVTWQQLGYHQKPVGILNVCGYFNHLIKFVNHMTQEGFVRESARQILQDADTPSELIEKLESYKAPKSLVKLLAEESAERASAGSMQNAKLIP